MIGKNPLPCARGCDSLRAGSAALPRGHGSESSCSNQPAPGTLAAAPVAACPWRRGEAAPRFPENQSIQRPYNGREEAMP
jgi:hypothetical protein